MHLKLILPSKFLKANVDFRYKYIRSIKIYAKKMLYILMHTYEYFIKKQQTFI